MDSKNLPAMILILDAIFAKCTFTLYFCSILILGWWWP